jgi:hypothetical protein
MGLSVPMFESVRGLRSIFSVMGYNDLYRPVVKIDGALEPSRAVEQVTDNFFRGLGVVAAIGRTESETSGAVIGYRLWKTRFGGSASVLGRTLNVDGQIYPIVGVAPARFLGLSLDGSTDKWLLTPVSGPFAPWIIARLQSGVKPQQAQAATEVLFRQLDQQSDANRRASRSFASDPLRKGLTGLNIGVTNRKSRMRSLWKASRVMLSVAHQGAAVSAGRTESP